MKVAIEMFSVIICITLACILFSSIISSNNQAMEARDFYNISVNRIEDSNCNNQVIEDCKAEAEERGYELILKDLTIYAEHPSRLVTLKYKVLLPVFHLFGDKVEKQAIIEGYAR